MMTTDSKEHLSELMDGEIGGDTGRFVMRRLEASVELRGTWARYHLIRDCMRYQDRGFADGELSARVRNAIEDGAVSAGQGVASRSGQRWLRPVAGFAVAAAVAMMAVIAVAPDLSNAPATTGTEIAGQEARPFTSPNILARSPVSRQVNLNGSDEQAGVRKMNSYLLRHYQVAGVSGGNGFVSFVPIVISKSDTQAQAGNGGAAQQNPEHVSETASQ